MSRKTNCDPFLQFDATQQWDGIFLCKFTSKKWCSCWNNWWCVWKISWCSSHLGTVTLRKSTWASRISHQNELSNWDVLWMWKTLWILNTEWTKDSNVFIIVMQIVFVMITVWLLRLIKMLEKWKNMYFTKFNYDRHEKYFMYFPITMPCQS